MKESLAKLSACLIVALLFVSAMAVVLVVKGEGANDSSRAKIEASDITSSYLIISSIQLSGTQPQLDQIVSTGAIIYYNLTAGAGAPVPLNQLNITWKLQDDLNQTLFKYGASIQCLWNNQAIHPITVTYYEQANVTNIGHQRIEVNVVTDIDGDGIPDWWERKYFGNLNTADETTDYDQDTWLDIQEYERSTNPTIAYEPSEIRPGVLDQYWWIIVIVVVVLMLGMMFQFMIRPKMKKEREEDEKKKIAAAVEVEKSLLGLDELEEKPKK